MGRIKTKDIKRLAIQIHEKYKDSFTEDYARNKEILKELLKQTGEEQSKRATNKIAGYILRQVKLREF